MISVFSNTLGAEELAEVERVMASRWIGTGPECELFEKELAAHFGVRQLLLTNCATDAIYLALRCLGLKPGDEVVVPAVHFVACAGAVLQLGGVPVFADVDPRTLNLTGREIARRRTSKTVGVILNHYGGHPCNMDEVQMATWRLWVLEDAANAPYSQFKGRACGTLGDAGVWSFDAMKILSMADGGALWLRADQRHDRAWRLRNLGLDTFSGAAKAAEDGGRWWEFTVPEPSGRSDSNDLLACIGRVQLRKLRRFVCDRRKVWDVYQRELEGVGDLALPPEPSQWCRSSYYLYWVQTERRDELARFLYEQGVYSTFRYFPLNKAFGIDADVPYAERAAAVTLNLPIHQNLTDDDVGYIIDKVKEFYKWAGQS